MRTTSGGFDVDLRFYYATLFCDVTDQIRVYGKLLARKGTSITES